MDNRRTSNRTKVDVLINRFLDGHPFMCRMTDISSTGLRIVPLLGPSRTHQFMGLQFQLPGVDGVFTASGEAVNGSHDGAGYGVRFTSLAPERSSAIARFVHERFAGGN
jgi:hypothetical protein